MNKWMKVLCGLQVVIDVWLLFRLKVALMYNLLLKQKGTLLKSTGTYVNLCFLFYYYYYHYYSFNQLTIVGEPINTKFPKLAPKDTVIYRAYAEKPVSCAKCYTAEIL